MPAVSHGAVRRPPSRVAPRRGLAGAPADAGPPSRLRVVLFSGGRGAGALARQLVRQDGIDLTLAVNGYDDGASTGEVRRFLGRSLGPSDFRKNASRLASELGTAAPSLIALLDARLPEGCDVARARAALAAVGAPAPGPADEVARTFWQLSHPAGEHDWVGTVRDCLDAFDTVISRADAPPFDFSDCSVGNLVFAGASLRASGDFNAAVADYCALVGLPPGLIENVTDGADAYLVALDTAGTLLASEEQIVDAKRHNRIDDIFLIDRRLTGEDVASLQAQSIADRRMWLQQHTATLRLNPALRDRLGDADLIIYAPGTQHSSLFPSYLTPGLSDAIAGNLRAIKLLVTNLREDAEIAGASAVDIIDRALFYLREKGRRTMPTPCLITHYLINDPGQESPAPYVPLGAVEALEDPRLVRIGNYEDGVSGRHNADKILGPFIRSLLGVDRAPAVAVYLHDADSPNKLTQTMLEMVRGGIADLPLRLTLLYTGPAALEPAFVTSLPFEVRHLAAAEVLAQLRGGDFEYVILFESSGMYRGDDIVALASQLVFVRLDAVWGSRRLSARDVETALQLVYRHNWALRAASRFGSHALSLLYLVLYGQYISDTLSGARAVRAAYLHALDVDPAHKLANHQVLGALLRDRAEVLEIPVRFLPISPHRVKRTTVLDGLRAMLQIAAGRLRRAPVRPERPLERSADHSVTVGKA
jgi:2-phospho-L-lactate transferase/gluconeogenesis factor (CofD/UPF0052 family)